MSNITIGDRVAYRANVNKNLAASEQMIEDIEKDIEYTVRTIGAIVYKVDIDLSVDIRKITGDKKDGYELLARKIMETRDVLVRCEHELCNISKRKTMSKSRIDTIYHGYKCLIRSRNTIEIMDKYLKSLELALRHKKNGEKQDNKESYDKICDGETVSTVSNDIE